MAKKKTTKSKEPADDAPGWHAIDNAFARLYPRQSNPPHFAPPIPAVFSGDNGLINGISAYKAMKPAHWHLVTYGFSELYAKETDDPEVSGYGFELTLRLARASSEKQPPAFAIDFLFNLGRYVGRTGNPFGAGHAMDLNGPICVGSDTRIRGIAFADDPQFGPMDTPNGKVTFLQVVGLTMDEYDACGDWHTSHVLGMLRERDPLMITDLSRDSIFADPECAAQLQAGIDRDGSQSNTMYVSVADWSVTKKKAKATLGAKAIGGLVRKLRSRLLHRRDFRLLGREKGLMLRPAGAHGWETDDRLLTMDVTEQAVRAMMATLKPERGEYSWKEMPGFTLTVVPSEITNARGEVIEVIG